MYEDCVSLALLVGTLDHLGILIDPEGLGCLNSGILQSLSSSTLLLFFPVAAKKVAREEQDHTDDATNHCSRDGATIGGFYDDFRHGKRFLRRNLAVLSFKSILANTSNALLACVVLLLAFTAVSTIRHLLISRIPLRPIAKDHSDFLTIFFSIAGLQNTCVDITFTAPPRLSIFVRFLGARGSVEAGLLTFATNFHSNLALQPGVSNRAAAIHSHTRLYFTIPRQRIRRFVDARVRPELPLAMAALPTVKTVEIAGPIITCAPC
mmetsp:Transcript_24696/g.69210  ORF Transcript_24696/g.69210 Transcript_24696/m.69210 type:complete len:265 (+) Transcript_24696:61-855(+)